MISQNKIPYKIPTPNNMGVLRYILAIAVMIAHFNVATGNDFFFPVTSYDGVGGFFSLSGFLIYGSYLKRKSPRVYMASRAIRLLPAYFSTVIFFALLLCLLSIDPIINYFSSGHFWKYLVSNLAFMNFLEPTLPGVFTDQPIPAVNGSLWTMKVEWFLYISVPIVAWIVRKIKCKDVIFFVGIYIFSAIYAVICQYLYQRTDSTIFEIMGRQFMGQMMFFYCGVLIYFYFDSFLRYKTVLLLISLLILIIAPSNWIIFTALRPIGISILVVWLSMVGKWGTFFGKHDNVSYNMYLIHFPVVQILVSLALIDVLGNWGTFILYFISVVSLAIIQNKLIEIPLQKFLKKRYLH